MSNGSYRQAPLGSLEEELRPAGCRLPDQFYDRTKARISTFFGNGIVAHVSFGDPVCHILSDVIGAAGSDAGVPIKRGGTYVCMEGPQFSTKAESNTYRSWGMDLIGMTNLQEAKLAREAEICYSTMALVTDYDCWHPDHDSVTVADIIKNLTMNSENAQKIIRAAVNACRSNAPANAAVLFARHTDRSKKLRRKPERSWNCYLESTGRECPSSSIPEVISEQAGSSGHLFPSGCRHGSP